jgi:hypothetical protein
MARLALLDGNLVKAEEIAGSSPLTPISVPYPHYTILLGLANVELALGREDFEAALSYADEMIAEISAITRAGIPEVLFNKSRALFGLGHIEECHHTLADARSLAIELGSKQHLWQICTLLAGIEKQL